MEKVAALGKGAVLEVSGLAGEVASGPAGEKSDFFSRMPEYNRANQQGGVS